MLGITTCRAGWEGGGGELLLFSSHHFSVVCEGSSGLQGWEFWAAPKPPSSRHVLWLTGSRAGLESSRMGNVCLMQELWREVGPSLQFLALPRQCLLPASS